MASTSARALRLLSLLQAQRYWPGQALADRLGVSLRTLRRDVDRLRELGYPVEAQRGAEGGYQLAPGAALPPLVLDDDEAVALAVSLLSRAHDPGTGQAAARALAKVVQVMPKRLRQRVDALLATTETWAPPGPVVDPEVLARLAQAGRDSERVMLAYTSATGEPSERLVEPHRLVPLRAYWYLVAYDLSRHDWRTFRLDRVAQVALAGQPSVPRQLPGGDAVAFVRRGMAEAPRAWQVEAYVMAAPEEVRERLGRWAGVEADGDGTRLHLNVGSLEWAAVCLAMAGADAVVRQPPQLLALLSEWSSRMARVVGASAAG